MYYCDGKYCSRKEDCAHHQPDLTGRLQQWLDMSTQGSGRYWTDEDGNPRSEIEHWCGDGSVRYPYFVSAED
jgi:hypothetical protein